MQEQTKDGVDAKLASVRDQRKALEQRKSEREAKRQAERETRELAVELRIQPALEEAEDEHGPLGVEIERVDCLAASGELRGVVIVKRPHPATWAKFKATFASAKGAKADAALDKLWRPCVVWPPMDDVDALIEQHPRMVDHIADAIATLAGAKTEELSGK